MKQKQRSSQEAYAERLKEIEERMQSLRGLLDKHLRNGERPDWAHVGDLSYVAEQLHIAEAFMKNEDI